MKDIIKIRACVNCGFCCRQQPCRFGEWNHTLKQCLYLSFANGQSFCKRFDYIIKQPYADFEPAFGAGCCSNGNKLRTKIIQTKYKNVEQYVRNKKRN